MKTILLTASLLLAINAVACGDHDKTEVEDKDARITLINQSLLESLEDPGINFFMAFQTFNTTSSPFPDNYKFLIGSILPRPIAVISTRNADGSNNLAPFSFFTAVSAQPMIVAFCPMIRTSTGKRKDTLVNIEREREFVLNFCTEDNHLKVNQASSELPYGDDEFVFSGMHTLDSDEVRAKRLAESPIHFECRLRDILSYGSAPGSGALVTGEVVKVHVDPAIMKDGKIVTSLFKPVGRGAGNDWFKTDSVFQLERLMKSQIQK